MFSYYGSKGNLVNLYPAPQHSRIIEPFAGSARYALKYFDRDVILVDAYKTIVDIWKWLQLCSKDDILKLPRMKEGESVHDYNFDCTEAKDLMGFIIAKSTQSPRRTASYRATTARPNNVNYHIKKIAGNLYKIKHWEIILGSYTEIVNQTATWFIDPPYQFGGEVYIKSNAGWNYSELANWCRSRDGQIIVCENTKADWLDFYPMKKQRGSKHTTTEAIWSNMTHGFEMQQAVIL